MSRGEKPGLPLTPQDELKQLRRKEGDLSEQMKRYPLTAPDQSGFALLFRTLATIRESIAQILESIPSAGPSPTTGNYTGKDPQGRRRWRRSRRNR